MRGYVRRGGASLVVLALAACNAISGASDLSIGPAETALDGSAPAVEPGVISVTADGPDFGDAPCGKPTSERTLTLTETAGREAEWKVEIPPDAPFTVVGPSSGKLGPRESVNVRFVAQPRAAGPTETQILVTGGAIAKNVSLKVTGRGATVDLTPSKTDFGDVRMQVGASGTVAIANKGTEPLVIDGFDFAGPASTFTLGWGAGPFLTIPAGQSSNVTVQLAAGPVTSAPVTGTFTPRVQGTLCGDATPVVVSGNRVNLDLTVTPPSFGTVDCATTTSRTAVITSYASLAVTYTATLTNVVPAGAFSITSGATGSLQPGSTTPTTADIAIALSPSTPLGSASGNLEVDISGVPPPSGGKRTIPLSATVQGAILTLTPATITNFLYLGTGAPPDSKQVTVANTGNASVTGTWNLTRTSGDPAWIISGWPSTIGPGAQKNATVTFQPAGACPCEVKITFAPTSGAKLCTPAPTFTGQGSRLN